MKLARVVASRESAPVVALIQDDRVKLIAENVAELPQDVAVIGGNFDYWRDRIIEAAKTAPSLPLGQVELLSPVARAGKILGIARNFPAHAREQGMEPPSHQTWFAKMPTALNDPFAPVALPVVSERLDYEAELVAVIGKTARHVPADRAHEIIAGYMCGCDYSVRDWQKATPTMMMGKGFDTHAPVGPWMVTPDEIGEVETLMIRCRVNGELRQEAPAGDMLFPIAKQIEHLTAAFTLEPGDLIFTGTPAGVAMAMPEPRWLKAGDEVEVEIDRIGRIASRIVPESGECVMRSPASGQAG